MERRGGLYGLGLAGSTYYGRGFYRPPMKLIWVGDITFVPGGEAFFPKLQIFSVFLSDRLIGIWLALKPMVNSFWFWHARHPDLQREIN